MNEKKIDMFNDSDITITSKLFNNIQACRVDVEIMRNNKKKQLMET